MKTTKTMKITKTLIKLARIHGACPEALEWLAAHPGSNLSDLPEAYKVWAVSHTATPAHILEVLSGGASAYVRAVVARRSATPTHILEALSGDASEDVRAAVARHTATPAHILEVLSGGASAYVRAAVASHLARS